jgi:hypothetical protein
MKGGIKLYGSLHIAIELVWAQVKPGVARKNKTFKMWKNWSTRNLIR